VPSRNLSIHMLPYRVSTTLRHMLTEFSEVFCLFHELTFQVHG
jgi:hypothetical protein